MVDEAFYKQSTLPDLISGMDLPSLPETIGPYKIESLLSKGGMSLLYLGLHPDTKQAIAVKVLSPAYVNHPEAVSRFLKEAEIVELTNHPNIIKLYGQGTWENGLYIAMEFIRGLSLRHFILQESLSMKRALEIILQVAYALLHLHAHGVIHRDLKPENILIDEEGEIKVIDFGIAQLHDEKKAAGTEEKSSVFGTPNYMSPEQKEHPERATCASDIYSLGIILYELILGKFSHGMVNLSLLPKSLGKIVAKTLAVSVTERYKEVPAFIHDISQYLNSEEMEREKPGSDQIKEIYESLHRASQSLSPSDPPPWNALDLGIAKGRMSSPGGLYYDFFKLPKNSFLILISVSPLGTLESTVSIGILRGMIRSLIQETPEEFKLPKFTAVLNQILSHDPLHPEFGLSCVFLDPLRDQLTYISCGLDSLLHLPQGSRTPRVLTSENPLLGASSTVLFSETRDNWTQGDLLILHSFVVAPGSAATEGHTFEETLCAAVAEHNLLSAQPQATALLKQVASHPHFPLLRYPKALISIQRIM